MTLVFAIAGQDSMSIQGEITGECPLLRCAGFWLRHSVIEGIWVGEQREDGLRFTSGSWHEGRLSYGRFIRGLCRNW